MAVFRAIENRAYLIRAANTGISAIVAPDGRIVRASGLFVPALVTGVIHPRAARSPYTRYGDVFAWATAVVALMAVFAAMRADSAVWTQFTQGREVVRSSIGNHHNG